MRNSFYSLLRLAIISLLSIGIILQPDRATAGRGFIYDFEFTWLQIGVLVYAPLFFFRPQPHQPDAPAAKAAMAPISAAYNTSNFAATLQDGEPTLGGLMKKTIWAGLRADFEGTVVVHTFGSAIDTVVAAYEKPGSKSTFSEFRKLAVNDNSPIPGYSSKSSLVSLDVAKGKNYRFQVGGRRGAEGDIVLSLVRFPLGGGISAFLMEIGGNYPYQDRAYACTALPCQSAAFVLHNSTSKIVTVTPRVNLTDLFEVPAPISLKPGAVSLVRFGGKAGSTPAGGRASEIVFTFQSQVGARVIPSITARGFLALRDPLGQTDGLAVSVTDRIKVGVVNQVLVFEARITNTGQDVARGCHFRSPLAPFPAPYVLSAFQRFDSASNKPIGGPNQPLDIPPGTTYTVKLGVWTQIEWRADLEFGLNQYVNAFCLNRSAQKTNLANTFDVTTVGTGTYTDVATRLKPKRSVLVVPKSGSASFDVLAVNNGRSLPLLVRGRYLYPFSEYNPNAEYTVTACRLTPKGKCIRPAATDATWTPKKGEKAKFRVFVKAPIVDPGFDPKEKRIFVDFLGVEDREPNVFGSVDVAVDRK